MISFGPNWELQKLHPMSDENNSVLNKLKKPKNRKVHRSNCNFLYCMFCCIFKFIHFSKKNLSKQLLDMNIEEIAEFEKEISKLFCWKYKKKKIFFCCLSKFFEELDKINREVPFGGLIEVGDSKLEKPLNWSKVFRLHATFHDATVYLKTNQNIGPGYCYMVPFLNSKLNFCFLGHITRLAYFFFREYRHDTI